MVLHYILRHPLWFAFSSIVAVVISRIIVHRSRRKIFKCPFNSNCIKPPSSIVKDRKLRDKILKQRFRLSELPENPDVIVIGSGPGGLSTAVLLAKAGKKVLVLEQHDQAGGTCHTFVEKGFEFDTGIHYIGDMGSSIIKTLMDQLTNGQVIWDQMDDEFDVVAIVDGEKVKFHPRKSSRKEYTKDLVKSFPEEKQAIERFFELVAGTERQYEEIVVVKLLPKLIVKILLKLGLIKILLPAYGRFGSRTLTQILDELTSNSELKLVLAYLFGDHGLSPGEVPFTLHGSITHHYMNGAYYPRGGPSEIPLQMIPIIEEQGGRVLVKAPVSRIILDSRGKAQGVRVHSKHEGDVDIYAPIIVSDAGAVNTFTKLLPREIATKTSIYQQLQRVGLSDSYLTIFVGLKGSTEDLELKANNTWIFCNTDVDTIVKSTREITAEEAVYHEHPFIFLSFPSAKDRSYKDRCQGDTTTALALLYANYEWFEEWETRRHKHRGEDYDNLKNRMGQQIWEQCLKVYPQLENKVEYFNVGTPISNKHYLGGQRGEMYGLRQTKRFLPEVAMDLRPKTDVPGLFMTGQDILSGGFTPALVSGVLCVSSILGRNFFKDLQHVYETTNE